MSDRDDRRARLDALLLAERDDAYAEAFRSGLSALDTFARYTAGRRGLSKDAAVYVRTALGLLASTARTAARDGLISHGCAEALAEKAKTTCEALLGDVGPKEKST